MLENGLDVSNKRRTAFILLVLAPVALWATPLLCSASDWPPPDKKENWKLSPPPNPVPGDLKAPNGVNGVNRRVQVLRHGGMKGSFADPKFQLQPSVGTNINNTTWFKEYINKPSFYLGIEGSPTSLEGGLQWEPESPKKPGSIKRWSVFYRGSTTHVISSETKVGYGAWQTLSTNVGGYQKLGVTTLTIQPEADGRVSLTASFAGKPSIKGVFTGMWPMVAGHVDNNAISVRRVVVLTQAGGDREAGNAGHRTLLRLDGSFVENLHFYNGKVAELDPDSSTSKFILKPSSAGFINWPSPSSQSPRTPDQHRTAAVGKNSDDVDVNLDNLMPDTRVTATAPWIIDFPDTPRASTGNGNYVTGYPNEKVFIDLRTKKTVKGKRATGISTPTNEKESLWAMMP